MALTLTRWIGAVAIICMLMTGASLARDPGTPRVPMASSADTLRLRDLHRRVGQATRRWEALARRDSVIARLPKSNGAGAVAPLVVIDPLLPVTHRSMIERAIQRQWTSLRIDSARVPVAVVVVIDTTTSADGSMRDGRGRFAYDYMPPPRGGTERNQRCVVIATVQSRRIVQPGSQRAFNQLIATPMSASALLGPCAFLARFGKPGPGIDQWLRSRSYDLAAFPQWWSLPAAGGEAIGERWRLANAGAPAMPMIWLSLEAQGCLAGDTARCTDALAAAAAHETTPADGLIIMPRGRYQDWSAMSGRYVSDLVTVLGPERFERFWRSELDPSAALQAVAMIPLNVWTQQWASGLLGEQRVSPAISLTELAAALTLAGLSLALAAWGWGRREVR